MVSSATGTVAASPRWLVPIVFSPPRPGVTVAIGATFRRRSANVSGTGSNAWNVACGNARAQISAVWPTFEDHPRIPADRLEVAWSQGVTFDERERTGGACQMSRRRTNHRPPPPAPHPRVVTSGSDIGPVPSRSAAGSAP
jgi:hypothetical protein